MSFGLRLLSANDTVTIDGDHVAWTYYKSTKCVIANANYAVININPAYKYLVLVESPYHVAVAVWVGMSFVMTNPNRLTIVVVNDPGGPGWPADYLTQLTFHIYSTYKPPVVSTWGLKVYNAFGQEVFDTTREYLDMVASFEVPNPTVIKTWINDGVGGGFWSYGADTLTFTFNNAYNDDIIYPAIRGAGSWFKGTGDGTYSNANRGGFMMPRKDFNNQISMWFTYLSTTSGSLENHKHAIKFPVYRRPQNPVFEYLYSIF